MDSIALHEKTKSYDWDFSYAPRPQRYPTKFRLPGKGRDPFRLMIRDYARMEAEKDDRVFGFQDGAVRMRMSEHVDARFNECMKLTFTDFTNVEYQAIAGVARIMEAVPNPEMRQGYQAQMMDEVRHAQLEMSLRKYYAKHALDPAGWDISQRALYQHPGGLVSVAAAAQLNTGDVVENIVALNIVLETGFTNILLVAPAQTAALHGDHAMATTLLSIQSDEARHAANGYGSVLSLLQHADNVPLVNQALNSNFWVMHRAVDALASWQQEYGSSRRAYAYRERWQEWVVDDFVGNYIAKLAPFGLQVPKRLDEAAAALEFMPHSIGLALAAIWPLNFWRSDRMRSEDMAYFEQHYPGWHAIYGGFWEGYAALADPAAGRLIMQELPALPPFCQICQLPCVLPHPGANAVRLVSLPEGTFATCSDGCEEVLRETPLRYSGRRQFWAKYHGWDLADVILDLGYVRPDGKTLMGQPALDLPRLWTLDDIRAIGYEVKDPLHGV